MKLSIEHRNKKSKSIGKKVKDTTPRDLGPADTTLAQVDRLYNCVVVVMWRVNGSMVNILWDRSTEDELAKFKRPCTPGGKRR